MDKCMFWVGVFVLLIVSGCDVDIDDLIDEGEGKSTDPSDVDVDSDGDVPLDGVDVLVVMDNSASMTEEQQTFSTGFYTLINTLMSPTDGQSVENIRVGVTTSDMGLQYGWNREYDDSVDWISGCESLRGDDGALMPIAEGLAAISVPSGVIECEPGGGQCPAEYTCEDGYCEAPNGVETVSCTPKGEDGEVVDLEGGELVTTSANNPNLNLHTHVACLAHQGTGGCGIEQQLSAATRLVENTASFLKDNHALQVIIVSDEEDCSIEDPGLFDTPEFMSGATGRLNIACNYPEENNDYLFDVSELRDFIVDAKGGREDDVFFAAIVGVPQVDDCQGDGSELGDCLDHPDMEMVPEENFNENGTPFVHFSPACVRTVDTGKVVTNATPGRRYVDMVEQFGQNGFVYSICNENWEPGMEIIADALVDRIIEPGDVI